MLHLYVSIRLRPIWLCLRLYYRMYQQVQDEQLKIDVIPALTTLTAYTDLASTTHMTSRR